MPNFKTGVLSIVALGSMLIATQAFASGYEKNIMWGGRSAAIAGIATPYMQGSQALYFNPAGLVTEKADQQDVSFNLSPTSVQFSGPINNTNDSVSSSNSVVLPFSLIYGKTINETWGWGIGAYTSGGASADYEDVDFGPFKGPDEKTDVKIYELSAGIGYRASSNLKLGAAWRVVMTQAEFASIARAPNGALLNLKLSGLKDTNYTGFKLGGQYKVNDQTLVGLMYRSEVNLQATGDLSGDLYAPGGAAKFGVTPSSATAKTTFPMAVTLGAQHDFSDLWRGLAEYNWTQYSRVGEVIVDGTIAAPGAGFTKDGARIRQDWRDQQALRLGGEYLGTAWPIRFGFTYTNQVTNADWARAAFVPPGPVYALTLGSGKTFNVGDKPLQFDGALEYEMGQGDATNAVASGNTTNDNRAGTYKVTALGLHVGLDYAF